ncbi:hypothetical protein LTR56_005372 [Elasticomyces elasticus]|nr:hypothetical protein LTR22_018667 [Elasticomyces elasticus]KAK3651866.1 hypothetical protein LTR56_005372 [Elasticomyces elasticus]KAK4927761.1 hypothetical protein LTR49_005384 [Elasticomyces elasticus]KAK5761432.1 hypothetical protein LTS12_008392 [Elasticomyces elasticus]
MIPPIQPSDHMTIALETTANDGARNDGSPVKHLVKLTDFPHELLLKIFGYAIAGTNPEVEYVSPKAKRFGFALAIFAFQSSDAAYKDYKHLMAGLRLSKDIYRVTSEAYFTQRRFSLRLGGRHPPSPLSQWRNFSEVFVFTPRCQEKALPLLPPRQSRPKSNIALGLLSAFSGGSFADYAIYYDNVRNLSIFITPTELTDALTLGSHLVPVSERCQKVASIDVLFTSAGSNTVWRGEGEATEMIEAMVAEYEKRFNRMVKIRWLTNDVLHLLHPKPVTPRMEMVE